MVNPGAFLGTRKEFLAAQMDLYATAMTENHVADTVADIQRRYFKRFPMSLPHNEEPGEAWLAQVDDNSPDAEFLPPDEAKLDDAEFKVAKAAYDEQVKLLKFRKEQIARRLAYQHTKANKTSKHVDIGSDDPMVVLQAKLTGVPLKKPRLKTAFNVWGKKNRQFVDAIFEERVRIENIPGNQRAALRLRVCKQCFDELDEDERKEYEKLAADEHEIALKKIQDALDAPPSEDPSDRQQVLKGLPTVIQPILDLVTQYTGWKATLLVGGPEPADNGRLNIMSFHSGETPGNVKMNFGRAERQAYKKYITPIFGNFLKKCYTVEECRAAALSDTQATSLAELLRVDGGEFSVDSAEDAVNYVKIARHFGDRSVSGGSQNSDTSSTPASNSTYEVPAKIGPPIHSKKSRTAAMQATVQPPEPSDNLSPNTTPSAQAATSEQTSGNPLSPRLSPCHSIVPLPAPSLPLSPLASPCISPIPLPCASESGPSTPAAGLLLSPAPPPPAAPLSEPPHTASVHAPQAVISPPTRSLSSQVPSYPINANLLPAEAAEVVNPEHAANSAPLISLNVDENESLVTHAVANPPTASSPMATAPQKRRRRRESVPEEGTANSGQEPRKRLRVAKGGDRAPRQATPSCSATSSPNVSGENGAQSATPLTPEELSGVPDWFLNAYQMLISVDLGPAWMHLIRSWTHFEQTEKYEEQGKIGTDGRPPCVGAWISRARSAKYRPDLGPLPIFEKSFNKWWAGLQPEWRVDGAVDGTLPREEAGDLEDLHRPGKNGVLSILAALFFWGISAQKSRGNAHRRAWELAVDDVHWVIQHLNSH